MAATKPLFSFNDFAADVFGLARDDDVLVNKAVEHLQRIHNRLLELDLAAVLSGAREKLVEGAASVERLAEDTDEDQDDEDDASEGDRLQSRKPKSEYINSAASFVFVLNL